MSEGTMENRQGAGQKQSGLGGIIGVLVLVAAVVGAGYFFVSQANAAVAIVNGEKITRGQYNEHYAQLVANVTLQGGSATSTEVQAVIKEQTLDDLITESLLLQAAGSKGTTANVESIDAEIAQSKAQFADDAAFKKALTERGFTDSTFKSALTKTNIIQQYLQAELDLSSATSTPAEVKALYDQVAATNPGLPALAEIRDQVESQIVQEKQQHLISDYIAELKASSKIEILLK